MASRESQEIGDLWRSISTRMAANPGLDILSRRAILDVMQELASEPADVTYQEILAAGQQALWVNPLGAADDRVILFLHDKTVITTPAYFLSLSQSAGTAEPAGGVD